MESAMSVPQPPRDPDATRDRVGIYVDGPSLYEGTRSLIGDGRLMIEAQTESLWFRGLRDTGRALASWFPALAWAIGAAAAGVFLEPLAGLAIAVAIPGVTLAVHLLRAPVRQRDELRRALQGAESVDSETFVIVKALQAESVHILGQIRVSDTTL